MTTMTMAARARAPRTVDLALWAMYAGGGVLAGAAAGLAARIAMRLVVLIEGGTPDFTLVGTLGILVIFGAAGALLGVLWLGLARGLRVPARRGGLLLSLGLTLLLGWPLYRIALADLGAAADSPARIVRLLLLFAPVPWLLAGGTVWATARLQARMAHGPAKLLPLGTALVTAALLAAAFVSMIAAVSGAMRHPLLVSRLLGGGADFTAVAGAMRNLALLFFVVYMAIALAALWRQPGLRSVQWGAPLALALPTLLLAAGTALPGPLRWLPTAPWLLGLVQALGMAALLALWLTAGEFTPPRALVLGVAAAWGVAAIWLMAGQPQRWTQWTVWGMLAVALGLITHLRLRAQPAAGRAATWLLALFALGWLGAWAAALLTPGLHLRGVSPLAVTLSVPLFWLPWLLLPAALLPAGSNRN